MRILLDTCALIWFLRDDEDLSLIAADVIEDSANEVFISTASIWEIAIKSQLGKLEVPKGFQSTLPDELIQAGFQILPVTFGHAASILALPPIHRDPFDRLLIAQCHEEKLKPVTNDRIWQSYNLDVIW